MDVAKLPHHDQKSLCKTRTPYRQGRKLTAVKVYTICDESVYLLITKVPAIKIEREVTSLCQKFGSVEIIENLRNYPHDEFETTYLVKYSSVRFSRRAKRALDGRNFFGAVLHVCYAPELETVDETRNKLKERKSAYLSFQSNCLQKDKQTKCKRLCEDLKSISVNKLDKDFSNSSDLNNSFPVKHFKKTELCTISNSFTSTQNSKRYTLDGSLNSGFNSNAATVSLCNANTHLFDKKRLISSNIKSFKRPKNSRNFESKICQPPMNYLRKPIRAKDVKIK